MKKKNKINRTGGGRSMRNCAQSSTMVEMKTIRNNRNSTKWDKLDLFTVVMASLSL
jgi:hypothetical protein